MAALSPTSDTGLCGELDPAVTRSFLQSFHALRRVGLLGIKLQCSLITPNRCLEIAVRLVRLPEQVEGLCRRRIRRRIQLEQADGILDTTFAQHLPPDAIQLTDSEI